MSSCYLNIILLYISYAIDIHHQTMTPECRRYPWLFSLDAVDAREDILQSQSGNTRRYATINLIQNFFSRSPMTLDVTPDTSNKIEVIDLRPFNDPEVTCNDVLTLINSYNYKISRLDLKDIATSMRIEEISKLIQYNNFDHQLDIEDIKHNPDLSMETSKLLHQERLKLPGRAKITSYWSMDTLSRSIDVSQVLKHPELQWNRESMSYNDSITIEHTHLIDSGNAIGGWYLYPKNGLLGSVTRSVTSEDLIDSAMNGDPSRAMDRVIWRSASQRMHVDEIIRANDNLLMLGLEPQWTSDVWWNRSLTEDHIDALSMVLPQPRVHRLTRVQDIDVSELTPNEFNDLCKCVDSIKVLDIPCDILSRCNVAIPSDIYKYVDVNEVDMVKDTHQQHLRGILTRSDVTEEQARRIVSTCTPEILQSLVKPTHLHLDVVFDLFKNVTYQELQTMRWLDLDKITDYPCTFEDPSLCNMKELLELCKLPEPPTGAMMNPRITIDVITEVLSSRGLSLDNAPEGVIRRILSIIHPRELLKVSHLVTRVVLVDRLEKLHSMSSINKILGNDGDSLEALKRAYPYMFYRMYNQNGSLNTEDLSILMKAMRHNNITCDYNRYNALRIMDRDDITLRSLRPMIIPTETRFHDLDIITQ